MSFEFWIVGKADFELFNFELGIINPKFLTEQFKNQNRQRRQFKNQNSKFKTQIVTIVTIVTNVIKKKKVAVNTLCSNI